MMTSAPVCPAAAAAAGYPSPSPSACGDAEDDTATLRLATAKRPLFSGPAPSTAADTCKKRRKQSTPIRISTTTTATGTDTGTGVSLDIGLGFGLCYEGKLGPAFHSPEPEPEPDPDPDPDPDRDLDASTHAIKVEQPSSPVNLSGGQNFPPWLSDVQAKTSDWLNATSSSASAPLPGHNHSFYVPGPVSRGVVTNSQPPIRIFNPEAYCELCNKEFCNKYFLKTHKANKHRIYTDPPTSDAAVSLPVPVNVPSYQASTSAACGMKKISMPMPTPTSLSMCDGASPMPMSDFASTKHLLGLKTPHGVRVNVHGAMDQDTTHTDAESLSLSATTTTVDIPAAAVHKEDSEFGDMSAALSLTTTVTADKNDHFKEDAAISQLSTMDQEENSENAVALNSREREILSFSETRRRLGIMNPEAFCEICCKEYCNKYFLRTHKMKRHGILIPDDNSKDNQKDFKLELSISNNWYQIQTSPLNLIMGEQNTNSSGSCSERKSSPANENECEICGMRFQTLYLAQLHFASVHSHSHPHLSQSRPTSSNNDEFTIAAANNNDKHGPDSISEDLQKLQTMILQLNDLDVSKVAVAVGSSSSDGAGAQRTTCTMCAKEFDNRYYLHAHLMTEHGVLLENNTNVPVADKQFEMDNTSDMSTTATAIAQAPETLHQQCIDNQKISISSAMSSTTPTLMSTLTISTGIVDKKDDSNGFMSSEKMRTNTNGTGSSMSVGPERRSSVSMTPANSYCEICNKELCNKYFMKTHMQRMHGIEIENGAQIGGVVCNICNKELCSKYFLRVHKHNTHGIVQDNIGANSNQSRPPNLDLDQQGVGTPLVSLTTVTPTPTSATDVVSATSSLQDSTLKLGDLSDLSNRYFTHFTEVCTICSRRFRSTKWLKAHLLGDHGKAGTEKWNELELQLQQSFSQQQQTQQRKNNNMGDRSSPTLRIPNGGQDSIKSEGGGMQNVLSSIFGTDEANVKQYHCSFCSFSTPVLAFLFVHERSHSHTNNTSPSTNTNTNTNTNTGNVSLSAISPLYCAVCNQSFRQPEQLHHHIVSQHTFLSLSSFFGNVNVRQPQGEESLPAPVSAPVSVPPPAPPPPPPAPDITMCNACGRGGNKRLELSTDVLKDVSAQRQLPATYALPQLEQLKAKYMMQAFLMDEPTNKVTDAETNGDDQHTATTTTDRRFAPSIVFLPVLEKLTAPLTVSFTLTPA